MTLGLMRTKRVRYERQERVEIGSQPCQLKRMRTVCSLVLWLIAASVSQAALAKAAMSTEEATFRHWLINYLKSDPLTP